MPRIHDDENFVIEYCPGYPKEYALDRKEPSLVGDGAVVLNNIGWYDWRHEAFESMNKNGYQMSVDEILGVEYVVVRDEVLGYTNSEMRKKTPNSIGILASKPSSVWSHLDGTMPKPMKPESIRPATLADFEAYRVSPPPNMK